MVVLKKSSKDDGFEDEVSRTLIPFIGQPKATVKRAVADIFKDSNLLSFDDKDVEDCTLIANVNGKTKKIYLIETGDFSTRFPLEVPFDGHGHPQSGPAMHKMLDIL